MAKSKNNGGTPATTATSATNWEELRRPNSYQEAVGVAWRLIAARLNADPKARWRIRIDRTEQGPTRIFLKTDLEGRTRAEFFGRLAAGDGALSVADQAMAARLHREQIAFPQGRGRSTRAQAALRNPAGQSIDAIIYDTCLMLMRLGWTPLSRADVTGEQTSIFDAVAEALSANRPRPVAYQGVRDAYYRVSKLMPIL